MTKAESEMVASFVYAIRESGGCAAHFMKDLHTMTVNELIESLASNGVRFHYKKKRDNNG